MKLKRGITDHDHGHSNKSITTQELSKLTAQNFAGRLTQSNKNDVTNFVKKRD